MIRGTAIFAVVIHHWLLFVPRANGLPVSQQAANLIETVAGTAVHLFFILSGYGLTLSYLRSPTFSWSYWAKRRFVKIVFPYMAIVTITFLLVNILHIISPEVSAESASPITLIVYLTFTRNFYSPSWLFNPTLWFMPVIIGLYILFPPLLVILKKLGPWRLLLISALVTYFSITLCLAVDYPVEHQPALPFFFVIEFSLGMCLGQASYRNPAYLAKLAKFSMFFIGICSYTISWAMTRYLAVGSVYNDLFTAIGVLLIGLYACRLVLEAAGQWFKRAFDLLSKQSYYMYLLHGPLILFAAIPMLKWLEILPLNSLFSLFLALVCCWFVFLLSIGLAWPMGHLTERLAKVMIKVVD